MSLEFIFNFLVINIATVGLADLYLYLIQPNQLLSFIDRLIVKLQNKKHPLLIYIHKSIGGCKVCTMQRFLDITYIILLNLCHIHWAWWFPFYCLYGGLGFYFMAALNKQQPKKDRIVKIEKLDIP